MPVHKLWRASSFYYDGGKYGELFLFVTDCVQTFFGTSAFLFLKITEYYENSKKLLNGISKKVKNGEGMTGDETESKKV